MYQNMTVVYFNLGRN